MSTAIETNTETALVVTEDEHKKNADQLLQSYNATQELINRTKSIGLDAIDEAIRCGKLFNAQKEQVGFGNWEDWVESYLPDVHLRTVQQWMQLAKTNRDSFLTDKEKEKPKSIRQALIGLKKIADPLVRKTRKRELVKRVKTPKPTDRYYLVSIRDFLAGDAINVLIQTEDFSDWDTHELEAAIQAIEPITLVRNRMAYALGQKLRGVGTIEESVF